MSVNNHDFPRLAVNWLIESANTLLDQDSNNYKARALLIILYGTAGQWEQYNTHLNQAKAIMETNKAYAVCFQSLFFNLSNPAPFITSTPS